MSHPAISDTDWGRVADLLPGKRADSGRTARDNRLFMDAVLWIGRMGSLWRGLPEHFGKWNSVYRRFSRWSKAGVWERVFAKLQDPDLKWMMIDTTMAGAHPCAAGQK
jgi:transposase